MGVDLAEVRRVIVADPVVKIQDAEDDAPGVTARVRRLELPNGAIKRLAQLGELLAPQ